MKLNPDEITSIEDIGLLDGHPVKVLNHKGGFVVAVKENGDKSQVLSSGSHIGLVRHAICKAFKNFRPSLMKSESNEEHFTDYTHLLPDVLRKSGHNLIALYKNDGTTQYNISRHCWDHLSVIGSNDGDSLQLTKRPVKDQDGNIRPQFANIKDASSAIINAALSEAKKTSKDFIEFQGKKLSVNKPEGFK